MGTEEHEITRPGPYIFAKLFQRSNFCVSVCKKKNQPVLKSSILVSRRANEYVTFDLSHIMKFFSQSAES